MAKKFIIEIDSVEKKALELAARLAYEEWKKKKNKLTPNQKKWIDSIDKLYIFLKNL